MNTKAGNRKGVTAFGRETKILSTIESAGISAWVAVDVEGCLRVLHVPLTVDAVHCGLLVRKSCSHSYSVGMYAVMTTRKSSLGVQTT